MYRPPGAGWNRWRVAGSMLQPTLVPAGPYTSDGRADAISEHPYGDNSYGKGSGTLQSSMKPSVDVGSSMAHGDYHASVATPLKLPKRPTTWMLSELQRPPSEVSDFGRLDFPSARRAAAARWVRMPGPRGNDEARGAVATLRTLWKLPDPSVIISVAGSLDEDVAHVRGLRARSWEIQRVPKMRQTVTRKNKERKT